MTARHKQETGGFTLLELVVVLAIFALVALIGAQSIRATVTAEQRLSASAEATERLAVALALLRQDLNAAIALPFQPDPSRSDPALVVAADGGGFGLSIAGMAAAGPGPVAGQGRVVWRLDRATGQLMRQVWTVRVPGGPGAAGPDLAVLDNITDMEIFNYSTKAGWQRGFSHDPRDSLALPRGLRVRLHHGRFDTIDTVVALP